MRQQRVAAGGVAGAARTVLTEWGSFGNEETWATLVAKISPEDHNIASAAVAAAAGVLVLTSATEVEEGIAPQWCSDDDYTSQALRHHRLPQISIWLRKRR